MKKPRIGTPFLIHGITIIKRNETERNDMKWNELKRENRRINRRNDEEQRQKHKRNKKKKKKTKKKEVIQKPYAWLQKTNRPFLSFSLSISHSGRCCYVCFLFLLFAINKFYLVGAIPAENFTHFFSFFFCFSETKHFGHLPLAHWFDGSMSRNQCGFILDLMFRFLSLSSHQHGTGDLKSIEKKNSFTIRTVYYYIVEWEIWMSKQDLVATSNTRSFVDCFFFTFRRLINPDRRNFEVSKKEKIFLFIFFCLSQILEKIQITNIFFRFWFSGSYSFSSSFLHGSWQRNSFLFSFFFEREKFKMLLTNPGQFCHFLRQLNLFISMFCVFQKKKTKEKNPI